MGQALQEMYPINEDNIDLMRKAAAGAAQTVKMKDGKLKMDMFTASAIMQILDKVNPANKKKMTDMINKGTKGGMMKLQDFAMKQVKSENDPAIEEEVDLDEKKKGTAHASLKDVMALDKKNAADKKQAKKDKKRDDANRKSNRAAGMEEVDLDEFTVSDVEIAMKKKYGKVDKEAIEKLKKVQHMGNVDRNALVKVGHGKLHVESVDLDEGKILVADPKTQKVTKIDEKDWPEYKKKGYVQAEDVDLDEAVLEQLAKIKGNSPADKGRKAAVEDDIERAEKKGDKKEVEKLKEADLDEADDFKPHMMYDPKTGKGYKADTMDDHLRMKKMGYTHDAPKKEEVDLDEANFEIKNGKIHISKADYAKKPKEYKGKRGGKPTLMALDPKTGSTTSFEVVLEEVDLDEASARSDAMKAMRKGKSVDPADIDNTATDDDVRGASKNIIMQLRKAGNRASMGVEFGDGKKVQISPKMAIAVQQKYNAMKKPADKEKFQARIAKSYKDMLSALKEELQPKKESILERMNRKIKENKNG
jgi:hypothetical protein